MAVASQRDPIVDVFDVTTRTEQHEWTGPLSELVRDNFECELGDFLDDDFECVFLDEKQHVAIRGMLDGGDTRLVFGGGAAPLIEVRVRGAQSNPLRETVPTVRGFLHILVVDLVRHDTGIAETEMRQGKFVDFQRLEKHLEVQRMIQASMFDRLDSSSRADLLELRKRIRKGFDPKFMPVKKTLKSLNDYLTKGTTPRYWISEGELRATNPISDLDRRLARRLAEGRTR